ncbi:MAG: SOS response-associated peptidase [Actinobacteria bacterium]|jgi:putative SOS response-associated peptidase YedK|nr:SOS response-associated peptidase [Actinomycetota bacterium]NBP54189.1 SOS response-associated peptidase [Actinomycetota bacterium]
MCGRFVSSTPVSTLAAIFDAEVGDVSLRPSWNVAPTTRIAGIREHQGHRRLDTFVWGLMPAWRRSTPAPLINARAESVTEKPSFRGLVPQQRCVVPMTGYYEWLTTKEAKRKIPYFISRVDGAPLAVAGLWDVGDETSGGLPRACVITVAANPSLSEIHDRMPAILTGDSLEAWLEGDAIEAVTALRPLEEGILGAVEVSTKVNSVRNNDPTNVDPVAGQLPDSLFD